MKRKIFSAAMVIFMLSLLSCNSMPVNRSYTQSWRMPEMSNKAKQTICLAGVSVDRSGGWDSLEKEVTILAPLCFWKKGFRLVDSDSADYAAHISLREREYTAGWRTRRSLSLEVRVWACGDSSEMSRTLPIAAGRIVATGSKSFSSSAVTSKILSQAINKTLGKLPSVRKGA